ncbi:MAG: hypothetical protein D6776_05085 [Planctomycetota bacterium]|nr:MAG: hypothetical protein D6776_05085 [Planctomycetota bacterium]
MAKRAPQHELSWSVSRHGCWETCRRAYYYTYYLSWLGWIPGAPAERRQAWLLKKMGRMETESGRIVHAALERWCKGSWRAQPEPEAAMLRWAHEQLRVAYRESRDGAWRARPGRRCRLAEHHYGEPQIDEASGAAAAYGRRFVQRLQRCVHHFFSLPELADVRALPVYRPPTQHGEHVSRSLFACRGSSGARVLSCEELTGFEEAGCTVHVVLDLAFRDASGTVHVLDWKTGERRASHRLQAAVYALFARQRWRVEASALSVRMVYLERGEVVVHRFSERELERARSELRASIEAMRALHFDAGEHTGCPDDFPPLELGPDTVPTCARCNFRELCGRSALGSASERPPQQRGEAAALAAGGERSRVDADPRRD